MVKAGAVVCSLIGSAPTMPARSARISVSKITRFMMSPPYLQQLGRVVQAERLQQLLVQLFCSQQVGHIGQQPDAITQQEPFARFVRAILFAVEFVEREATRWTALRYAAGCSTASHSEKAASNPLRVTLTLRS